MRTKSFITVLFILDLVTTIHFTLLVNGMFPSEDIFQVGFHLHDIPANSHALGVSLTPAG